jgi:hypothetical protein
MTLTFQDYDQSTELREFEQRVAMMQDHIGSIRYPRGHNATIELTAYVPEQTELKTPPTP